MKTSKKNLANPEMKKVFKDLEEGKVPEGASPLRKYKHPIKSRQRVYSNAQCKAIRR